MDAQTLIEKFNNTIDIWISELNRFDEDQLTIKPDLNKWSLAKVYDHVIRETKFFLEQVRTCLSHNENSLAPKSEVSKQWFEQDSFPDEKIVGLPEVGTPIQQTSKAQLLKDMETLKMLANELGKELLAGVNQGKVRHPGHQFFNAKEWYHYAEMHARHHLKQKKDIEMHIIRHYPKR